MVMETKMMDHSKILLMLSNIMSVEKQLEGHQENIHLIVANYPS